MSRLAWILVVAVGATAFVAVNNRVTAGAVVALDVNNGRCNKGYDCTIYDARFEYHVDGQSHRATDHTWAHGHDRPPTDGPYQVGDTAWVAYHPATPSFGVVLSAHRVGGLALLLAIPMIWAAGVLLDPLKARAR